MESNVLDDELCGDFKQDQYNMGACSEDSLDIYSGLDASPRSDADKPCTLLSPRLRESMDLYEELVTEEQQSKESSHNELKGKLSAAQSQLEELRSRLQLMETQNLNLTGENICLRKNISALVRTAKMEIVRKDEEISRLSQRSRRATVHPPHINGLRDPVSSRLTSSEPFKPSPPTHLQGPGVDHASNNRLSLPPPPPPPSSPPPPPPPPPLPQPPCKEKGVICTLDDPDVDKTDSRPPPHVNSKCPTKGENETPVKHTDSSISKSSNNSASEHSLLDKHRQTKRRESKIENLKPSDSTERRHKNSPDPSKECQAEERGRSHRSQRHDPKSSKIKYYSSDNEGHRRSERTKSPLLDIVHGTSSSALASKGLSEDERCGSALRSKGSREFRHGRHGHDSSSKDLSSIKRRKVDSSSHSLTERSSGSLNRERGASPSQDYGRKEERRREDETQRRWERRGTLTERSNENERKMGWKTGPISKDEERRTGPISKDEERKTGPISKDEERRQVSISKDEERKTGPISKDEERKTDPISKDEERRTVSISKDEERRTVSIGKDEERRTVSIGKDVVRKTGLIRRDAWRKTGLIVKDAERKTGPIGKDEERTTCEESDVPPTEPKVAEKIPVEENSPNRKLSFMETLNLTLSPVKKPSQPAEAKEQEVSSLEEVAEGNSGEESSVQLNIEDFCVIDEASCNDSMDISSSEALVETNEASVDNAVPASSDVPTPLDPVNVKGGCIDREPYQKINRSAALTEATVVNEQPECQLELNDKPAGLKSRNQLPNVTDEPQTEPHTLEPLKERCGLVLETTLQSTDLISASPTVESDHQTAATCLADSRADREICDLPISDNLTGESVGVTDGALHSNAETLKSPLVQTVPVSVDCGHPEDPLVKDDGKTKPERRRSSSCIQPEGFQQQLSTSVTEHCSHRAEAPQIEDVSKDADVVSSTIIIEVPPQDELASEAISDIKPMDEDEVGGPAAEQSSPMRSIAVSKVSSTTDQVAPSENHKSSLAQSPKVSCKTDSSRTENEEGNVEPSSSIPFLHDEESMMKTLNSLRSFPDALSPLRSPARPIRRSQLPCQANKPAHVKSLGKELSSVVVEATSVKLDVNKENKNPGGLTKQLTQSTVDQTSKLPSSQLENELEEGEIISGSEEEEPPISEHPSPTVRPTKTAKTQPSPQSSSRLSKRVPKETWKLAASQESPTAKGKAMASTSGSPSSSSSCSKTASPPSTPTSCSTTEEVMEMLRKSRYEVRKKYMKLHKIFPISSFYGIMRKAQVSFIDFVDRTSFSELCDQGDDLKAKLKTIISSVLSKVSKNGIVNRIFDQKSELLKQKLWEFVDVQLDFMFSEIRTAMASVCKASKESVLSSTVRGKKLCKSKKMIKLLKSPGNATFRKQQLKSPVSASSKKQHLKSPTTTDLRPGVTHESVETNVNKSRCLTVGLGSRGKNIKMTVDEEEEEEEEAATSPKKQMSDHPSMRTVVEMLPPKNLPSTSVKAASLVRRLSQNSSVLDKSEFEILTEQQASSLTFNLVADVQMGEIFKCLLQGTDLMDTPSSAMDGNGWPVGTPRKEASPGERLLGIATPRKDGSPSRLIATWSAISPRKMSSTPNVKVQIPVNPAALDESCLLEVPSDLSQDRIPPQYNVCSQRSYSILTEDLAVSLTIPSPLKSDSHLSFLHPVAGEAMSAPDSVISAHFSEDALLDGEDATEQDIHLALDTDNSSCDSNSGRPIETAAPPLFIFKPHLPMQAVVMEKSNDHFIVKIRQASPCIHPGGEETLTKTPSREEEHCNNATHTSPSKAPSEDSPPSHPASTETVNYNMIPQVPSESSGDDMEGSSISGKNPPITDACATPKKSRKDRETGMKRKKVLQVKPKAKRAKKEVIHERSKQEKGSREKKSRTSKKESRKVSSPSVPLSPNSLSAKNVIKKKGEVVVTWTRDEDRAILLDLKMKGASSNTFTALSDKLNKSPAQIAERFGQLMKLFKKKEKEKIQS